MLELQDGPLGINDWGNFRYEEGTTKIIEVWYEESNTTVPFTTSRVMMTRGKYAGSLLSEVSDTWYLKFIMEKNPDDGFIKEAFTKRLEELK